MNRISKDVLFYTILPYMIHPKYRLICSELDENFTKLYNFKPIPFHLIIASNKGDIKILLHMISYYKMTYYTSFITNKLKMIILISRNWKEILDIIISGMNNENIVALLCKMWISRDAHHFNYICNKYKLDPTWTHKLISLISKNINYDSYNVILTWEGLFDPKIPDEHVKKLISLYLTDDYKSIGLEELITTNYRARKAITYILSDRLINIPNIVRYILDNVKEINPEYLKMMKERYPGIFKNEPNLG